MHSQTPRQIGAGISMADVEARIRKHFTAEQFCGFFVPCGWAQVVSDLHDQLLAIDENYALNQAKEKFGELRYYATASRSCQDSQKFLELIDKATLQSRKTCQDCGKPGEIGGKLWITTQCLDCRALGE